MEATLLFVVITYYYILHNIFQLKHFLADFPLQNEYMLGKFKETGWVKPLAAHCGVHAFLTLCILTAFCGWLSYTSILLLALMDFVIHFCMDRIKASPNMLGKFKTLTKDEYLTATDEQKKDNKWFWWSLGGDQMVHGLTHDLIIYIAMAMLILG